MPVWSFSVLVIGTSSHPITNGFLLYYVGEQDCRRPTYAEGSHGLMKDVVICFCFAHVMVFGYYVMYFVFFCWCV